MADFLDETDFNCLQVNTRKAWPRVLSHGHAPCKPALHTFGCGSLTMTSMRDIMEGFPDRGVYTGNSVDQRGCSNLPSRLAMLCKDP